MAKRITSDASKEPATFAPDNDQACDDRRTADLLRISVKTLQRLDARKAGPAFFTVGSRKRRTLGSIRQFQKDNAA